MIPTTLEGYGVALQSLQPCWLSIAPGCSSASQRLKPWKDSFLTGRRSSAAVRGNQLSQRRQDWKYKTSPAGRALSSESQWFFISFEGRLCWKMTEWTSQSCWFLAKTKNKPRKTLYREKKMALNYRGFLQSCCVFLLLYLFFNIIQRSLFHSSSLIPVRSLIYSQLISSLPRKRKD